MKRKCKDKKRRFCIDRLFRGFTLVELLAVIVILAIIMLIAIPAILNSLETARKKTFIEFSTKSYDAAIKSYLSEQISNGVVESCVVYNIKTDLGMNNTGDYNGYVLIVNDSTEPKYYIVLYDNEYVIGPALYNDSNFNVTKIRKYTNIKDEDLKASLALEGGCITYTNKKDGSSGTSIPEDGISKKLKVEDYVYYYPTVTSYTLTPELTGCATTEDCSDSVINPSLATLWKVISINDNGTVIIGGKSKELVYLFGINGYQNGVQVLVDAAEKFNDNRFAKEARALGYNNQVKILPESDVSDVRTCVEGIDELHGAENTRCLSIVSSMNSGDDLYKNDFDLLTQSNRSFLKDSFFASRDIDKSAKWDYGLCMRRLWMNGSSAITFCPGAYPGKFPLFGRVTSCHGEDTYECKIFHRGITSAYNEGYVGVLVTLKANVKVASGDGSRDDPYELKF